MTNNQATIEKDRQTATDLYTDAHVACLCRLDEIYVLLQAVPMPSCEEAKVGWGNVKDLAHILCKLEEIVAVMRGDEFLPLTGPTDPRVTDFLEAWHANGRQSFRENYPNSYNRGFYDHPDHELKTARARRKYLCLDKGSSGCMMVEKDTGKVYAIRAYGKINRNRYLGTLAELTAKYREATEQGQLYRAC